MTESLIGLLPKQVVDPRTGMLTAGADLWFARLRDLLAGGGSAYQLTAQKDAASGYLGLNASARFAATKIGGGAVSDTEFGYLDGVSAALQTQLDAKLAAASYTAADVLAKVLTVDGAGSGIDADLLDGLSSAAFALAAARIGTIEGWGGTSAPTGALLCDGSAISRSTYSALFAIFGTAFGAGDGSTTFNLPDLRQRFPLGKAVSGTGSTLGGTGGTIDHVHTGPSHTHPLSNAGQAKIASISNMIEQERVAVSFTANRQASAVAGASTTESTLGVGLAGNTDAGGTGNTGTGNPPFQAVNFITWYA